MWPANAIMVAKEKTLLYPTEAKTVAIDSGGLIISGRFDFGRLYNNDFYFEVELYSSADQRFLQQTSLRNINM